VPAANQEETDGVMDERDRIVRRDPRSSYTSHFALMDQIHIDGDTSLRGYVTALWAVRMVPRSRSPGCTMAKRIRPGFNRRGWPWSMTTEDDDITSNRP
jgi:hypothetical protein